MSGLQEDLVAPDPIDLHVGRRIWARRRELRLSRRALGEILGVGLKQVNKYENAINRVSASRLFAIAAALGMPVAYFFDDYEDESGLPEPAGLGLEIGDSRETRALLTAYHAIPEEQRHRFLRLAKAIAETG